MSNSDYKIWIEAEEWSEGQWDKDNGNTDVILEFDNGERWSATFFTYSNISKLVDKNRETGECLSGKYFWARDMILIDKISRERIEGVIKHLISEGEFEDIFSKS